MKNKLTLSQRMSLQYATLVIPGLVIFTVGIVIPFCLGITYSFTSWNGISAEKPFVGLENYKRMFHDPLVGSAWWFTIKFTIVNTIVQNVCALLLAIALDSSIKGKTLLRTIFFLPCLISSLVVGYIWLRMYGNVLPDLLKNFVKPSSVMLFGREETVLWGLIIANNWQWIGYWMLIYLASLQSVPQELYEAATIDGAGTFARFFNVTIPMIAPAITICVVGITTGSLKVYDLLVSSTGGGPGRASTSIIFLIYSTAIGGRQYGYGSALSISLVLVLLLVAVVQLKGLRKKEVQL